MPRDTVSLKTAIRHIQRTQHVSRKEAERMLIEAVDSGQLPATHIDRRTGHKTNISPSNAPPLVHELSPIEAASMYETNPESVCFLLSEMVRWFGFTEDELLTELRAGRLTARGQMTIRGFKDINITALEVARWLNNPDAPADLQERVGQRLREGPTQH